MTDIFSRMLSAIVLPKQVTDFECRYLARMNKVGFLFFGLHIPVFMAVAFFNNTGPLLALGLTLAVMVGPAAAYYSLQNPRMISVVYGFTAMLMGGLLVHFGQGPVQIEMHFYFFALLAMLALFGNPAVILTAAVTVAVHHLVLWMVLPSSVFNYDAPIWVVLVHAGFVVVESVGTIFIARSFFDNVIGLEKIVNARTDQLDQRNKDMRLVLDHVEQGFVTIDIEGHMSSEFSSIVETWFGKIESLARFSDYIEATNEDFGFEFSIAWEQTVSGVLPVDVALDQMPKSLKLAEKTLFFNYTPIYDKEASLERLLLVISDMTSVLERKRLEAEHGETAAILERVTTDRAGFLEFYQEASELVDRIVDKNSSDLPLIMRMVHTLKGNTMIFGVQTVADICHEMETNMQDTGEIPNETLQLALAGRWERLNTRLNALLGDSSVNRTEITEDQFQELIRAVLQRNDSNKIAQMIADLRLESTYDRLKRISDQAQRIAERLGKGQVDVHITDSKLKLEPNRWASFWSTFLHAVRNSVDHGLEQQSVRDAAGKNKVGRLDLRTYVDKKDFVIELQDDGQGVCWDMVKTKADSMGLPSGDHNELKEALFHDGLSTKTEVSEFSGRGVGLSAVRKACADRGGTVEIESAQGSGTCIRFRFPVSAMAPRPEELIENTKPATAAA